MKNKIIVLQETTHTMDYAKQVALERVLAKQMLKMHPSEALDCALDYYYSAPFKWHGHSSKINKKTEIFVCDNLINFGYPPNTILHFTNENTIYGSSTDKDENGITYGEEPIYYFGNFEIDNHDFELSFDELKNGKIQFVPKKEAAF
jgi:hypothetical protein